MIFYDNDTGTIKILPDNYPLWALEPDFLEIGEEETIE